MAVIAIGTDTAGSTRVLAIFSDLVGVLPTPGRMFNNGVSLLIPLRDSCGQLAHSVADCARIRDVLVGYDPLDPATSIKYT
jgi:amidase